MNLEELNRADPGDLRAALLACCYVPQWADAVIAGRPYADEDALLATADRAARDLTDAQVERALAAHPRIGERARGSGTGSAWSRQEQSEVSRDAGTQAALVEANRDYEDRFGRVFLVCATGLSAAEVLAAARTRLGNDDDTERAVVADELRKIALLRLRKVLAG
jgi:2-oxo-4-hydroxy-4-carboxy-5-ureidoimidazoline decarboxylase